MIRGYEYETAVPTGSDQRGRVPGAVAETARLAAQVQELVARAEVVRVKLFGHKPTGLNEAKAKDGAGPASMASVLHALEVEMNALGAVLEDIDNRL